MTLSKPQRIILSALGYGFACLAGFCAVWLKNRGISLAEQTVSSGMFAFGDALTFMAVAAFISLPSTILLFTLIDPAFRLWRLCSTLSLLISLTGLLSALPMFIPDQNKKSLISYFQMWGILRVLCAPLWFLFFVPGLFILHLCFRSL